MGSDRARLSYDPNQQYRSVVMQQGRVTLEADFNEELAIAGEELREETLDIVGPSGTPDDGYAITPLSPSTFDFSVRAGTMYVGGLRVAAPAPVPRLSIAKSGKELDRNLRYLNQTDWLDHLGDPDWVDPSVNPPTTEFIYLFLREQEISAVEDADLKDVALGGPDTAQRTRLIQRIVRLAANPTCSAGLDAARHRWQTEGLGFNPATMRLESAATLQVGFSSSTSQPDPCNPQAQGGFLGADNQLIRVQISGIDQASGNPKFVWGFDDASFLYRLDLDTKNKQLLHLQSRPVDASHQPRVNQAVEVLRSAAELSNGEFVASLSGVVLALDKAYDPDTQMISLPAPLTKLPDEYYDPAQTPRVFLRVWEQEVIGTPGTPMGLGNTGLQVTLQAPGNVFHPGDYWLFAVRPSTPQQVYPERYLNAFQPPEGPRMWACPLATIDWTGQTPIALDCRRSFSPLVDLVTVEHNGNVVGVRNTLNFFGPGVTSVSDNPTAKRIDIQITGGGAGESSPTLLLFPYCRVEGSRTTTFEDTLIAISSTTANPFGPPQAPGAVTLYCFGTGLPSSPLMIPPTTLSPGQTVTVNLLDKLLSAGFTQGVFEGYVIADCAFAGAYGFAQVLNVQAVGILLTGSYLAIVLPRPVQLAIASLTPATATALVGGSVTFTISLTANAPTNTDVQISSSPSGVANVPSTVTVLAGSATATFTVSGIKAGAVNITATVPGAAGTATAVLTVVRLAVSSLTPSTATVIVGGSVTFTVNLTGNPPTTTTVQISASAPGIATIPSTVTVPAGAASATFTASGSSLGMVTITAFVPGTPGAAAALTVTPVVSSLTPPTATVIVGGSVTFTVNLTGNPPTTTTVQISASAPGIATIPSTVTVPAGSASATFTASGSSLGTVTITAAVPGTPGAAAALTVADIKVSSINAPTNMRDGDTRTGTVDLDSPAPTNGATVVLTSSNARILDVDPQVVVPQGSTTSPPFNIGPADNTTGNNVDVFITAEYPPGTTVTHKITVSSGATG